MEEELHAENTRFKHELQRREAELEELKTELEAMMVERKESIERMCKIIKDTRLGQAGCHG